MNDYKDCPNCKLAFPDANPPVCPRCGWDLHAEVQQTMQPGAEAVDDSDDFSIGSPSEAGSPIPTVTDTTPTIELPTIKVPNPIASWGEDATTPADASPDEGTANPDYLSQTLPSAHRPEPQKSANAEFEPTLISPSGKSPLTVPEKSQRSIKTVIPPRTISKEIQPGQLQDYKLGKRIGSGSFGVVYQALQIPLDRTVALKVLTSGDSASDEQREQIQTEFLREAQFTGRLEHPNIVPVHDIGLTIDERTDTARPFYVMKEIHGVPWLKRIQQLTRAENLEIFKRVVDAMGFAHDKNILHCDLKPENVMLGEFGEVLIVDWGQAVDLSDPESLRPGGTPAYISPEMATFWCDLYLDQQPNSPARALVGTRSDVYLLGAILLEIVTGKLPRCAIGDESQFDVMRRACQNETLDGALADSDELLQIARRALRKTDSEHIETITQLQTALQEFENRTLSIQLRERADQLLATAKSLNRYDDYQKSKFGYEESLEKWPENSASIRGLHDVRLSCATQALSDQNFDLGIDMLADTSTAPEKELKSRLVSGKKRRDQRKKLVRGLALGWTASILAAMVILGIMIKLNFDSVKIRDQALAEKKQIEDDIEPMRSELADSKATIVENEKQILQFPLRLAQEQKQFQSDLDKKKTQFETELSNERESFAKQLTAEQLASEKNLADERKKLDSQLRAERDKFAQQKTHLTIEIEELAGEVTNLNESSKVLKHKSAFTNILQKLDAGNYQDARVLLDAAPNKDHWEWGRLNLLAHREVESFYPAETLNAVCASHDGRLLGLGYDDRIEIRRNQHLAGKPITIPLANAHALALSNDGQRLAVGTIGRSGERLGVITIFDLSDPTQPRRIHRLDAPSQSITHLEFSRNDQLLLAVGQPNKIRKSAGRESELMVWSTDWEPKKIRLAEQQGALPTFSRASFSADGSKILTTNPDGLSRDQFVHLYSDSEQGFRWSSRSPTRGINCATFIDDNGTEIVGCARDSHSQTFSLVRWSPSNTPLVAETRLDPTKKGRGVTEQSLEFVSLGDANAGSQFISVVPVDNKVLSIWRSGDWIVLAGEGRQTTLWNWNTKSGKSYRGHSRKIDFCTLIPAVSTNENILISVSLGAEPEVLKTDLATWQTETVTLTIAQSTGDDKPSPTTHFRSTKTGHLAIGSDQGQAAVLFSPPSDPDNTGTIDINRDSIQWEVSAWKKHFLTDQFLFAQSRRDLLYKFDRVTGELNSVITKLAKEPTSRNRENQIRREIIEFDVSADGKRAVVITNQNRPEFEIWDLEKQSLIRTINYANENIFGSGSDKKLLLVKISPDGKWIVGGKVGLFAWSVDTGQQQELFQSATQSARTSVSDILFLSGSSRFLASWKGRIDLLDLEANTPAQRFNIERLSYSQNEPNLVDAKIDNNQVLVLARSTATKTSAEGIVLLDLTGESILEEFPGAHSASFSRQKRSEILVLREEKRQSVVQRYDLTTGTSNQVQLKNLIETFPRFQSCQNISESVEGDLVVQSLTSNPINPIRSNWNTISLKPDLSLGRLAALAKPPIQFIALADETAITLDSGSLRFWKYGQRGVRPNGIFPQRVNACQLSPDGKRLAIIPAAADRVLLVSPQNGKTMTQIRSSVFRQPRKDALNPNQPFAITAIQWSADSAQLLTGNTYGDVEIWNVADSNPQQTGLIAASTFPKTKTQIDSVDLVSTHSVTKLKLSLDGTSLLTRFDNIASVRISHFADDQWKSFLIAHEDGQQIVAGDISADGNRVVTGSDRGQLTIWNVESTNANYNSTQNSLPEFGTEREIFNLAEKHESRIRFVRFSESASGAPQIISAEENAGDNQYLIWPIQTPD